MKHLSLVCLVGCALACGQASEERRSSTEQPLESVSNDSGSGIMPVYRATHRSVDVAHVALRARRLTEVLLGREVPEEALLASYRGQSSRRYWAAAPIASRPNIIARYNPSQDDLSVTDHDLEDNVDVSLKSPELAQGEAHRIFHDQLNKLSESGLVRREELDLDNIQVGWTDYGEGRSDDLVAKPPVIMDYRYRVHRRLAGLPVLNSLVRVAVNRSGKVSSFRILRGSVEVSEQARKSRLLTGVDCETRFRNDFPKGKVKRRELGYFLPDVAVDGDAEPQCSFSFVEETVSEGVVALSRRKHVRYSLVQTDAPGTVLGGSTGDAGSADAK